MFDRERQVEGEELAKKLELITPSKKEDIMRTVQTIRQKSELLGEKRGRKELKKEMAERLLFKGMGIPFIEDTTGLPAKEIMKISDRLNRSKE